MDLFIESPRRREMPAGAPVPSPTGESGALGAQNHEHNQGRRRDAERVAAGAEPLAPAGGDAAPSIAAEAYREALAYDARRARRTKAARVARVLAMVVLTPIAMALIFLASYALTCIANGATPEELAVLMGELLHRVGEFAARMVGPA